MIPHWSTYHDYLIQKLTHSLGLPTRSQSFPLYLFRRVRNGMSFCNRNDRTSSLFRRETGPLSVTETGGSDNRHSYRQSFTTSCFRQCLTHLYDTRQQRVVPPSLRTNCTSRLRKVRHFPSYKLWMHLVPVSLGSPRVNVGTLLNLLQSTRT